jgi:DNA-binding XRE family transcriptional regulator
MHDRAREFGRRFSERSSGRMLEVYRKVLGTQAQMSYTLEPSRKSILLKEKGARSARTL